ncbi:MAG: hypothetical protein IKC32_00300 [Clostridia bacterium]|nr:hypothetical protein [Clostridia bacterium]
MADHVDKRLNVPSTIKEEDLDFHNVREAPFSIHGIFYEGGAFRRMPKEVAATVSKNVLALHANTSGGRIRFRTDSPAIAIKAKYGSVYRASHFSICGSAGFDLYLSEGGVPHFYGAFVPPGDATEGYASRHDIGEGGVREITIHTPLYSDLTDMEIGLAKGASILPPEPYPDEPPIVYYGSSITQGACVSRAGCAFAAIASEAVGRDFVNLGFSGSAKAEIEIAEYIAGLKMKIFVYDYDHNAPSAAYLAETHERMFKIVREKNPTLPVVMLSRTSLPRIVGERDLRRDIIKATYDRAREAGDENVYFIDGSGIYGDAVDYATVEGCHPNDLGHYLTAQALIPVLREILGE